MSFGVTAGAANAAAAKNAWNVITSSLEPLAGSISLPTAECCAFFATTRCTVARRPVRGPQIDKRRLGDAEVWGGRYGRVHVLTVPLVAGSERSRPDA